MPDLPDLLTKTAALHDHLCPRQVLGVRTGLLAARLFGLDLPQADKRLFAFVETDGCYSDGVSVSTGCWLGHRTLPYGFQPAGQEPHEVFCELIGPSGATWSYGPVSADSTIRGSASEFCRVGAHRLAPEQTSLQSEGPYALAALRVLRNYAA